MSNSLTQSNRRQPALGHFLVLSVMLLFTNSLRADQASLDKVDALHKERVSVLEKLVELRKNGYSQGSSSFKQWVQAEDQLAEAKYDAAKTPAERHAVRKKAVERWSEFEKFVTAKFEAGIVSQGDFLEAKAGHLQAKLMAARELDRKE